MSFHAHYGPTEHPQAKPRGRCLSSWCTGLKLLSPRSHHGLPPMFRHTVKLRRTSSGVMMSTWSTKQDGKQLFEMHGIARRSGAITSGLCTVGSSRWTIWCSGIYFPEKAYTSSPPTGRVLSGCHKSTGLDASAWQRRMEHHCQIEGTYNTSISFILSAEARLVFLYRLS
jgi:hypothetical protein